MYKHQHNKHNERSSSVLFAVKSLRNMISQIDGCCHLFFFGKVKSEPIYEICQKVQIVRIRNDDYFATALTNEIVVTNYVLFKCYLWFIMQSKAKCDCFLDST